MTWVTFFKVLGGLAAFGLGLFWGLGRYRQPLEEVDAALGEEGIRPKAKRHFTPFDLFGWGTGESRKGRSRHGGRSRIRLERRD